MGVAIGVLAYLLMAYAAGTKGNDGVRYMVVAIGSVLSIFIILMIASTVKMFFVDKKTSQKQEQQIIYVISYDTCDEQKPPPVIGQWPFGFIPYFYDSDFPRRNSICPLKKRVCPANHCPGYLCSLLHKSESEPHLHGL